MLGFESTSVINKRLAIVYGGSPQVLHEIPLMFAEKCDAAFEAGKALMFGSTLGGVVEGYRVRVARNEIRLSA